MSSPLGDFLCPPELAADAQIVLAGEYELPGADFGSPPRVVDVGANVGAFVRWAERRWPGATIDSYEPHPRVVPFLRRNADGRARVHAVAVSDASGEVVLHDGINNACESSICGEVIARGRIETPFLGVLWFLHRMGVRRPRRAIEGAP